MNRRFGFAVAAFLLVPWSCNSSDRGAMFSASKSEAPAQEPVEAAAAGVGGGGGAKEAPGELVAQPKVDPSRVIIYTADVAVYVDSFAATEKALPGLLSGFNAYLSDSNVSRYDGARRMGRWTIRVPVEHYRDLLNALSGLGSVESSTSKAEDVTAEFVDLEARQKNKHEVEQRLQTILKQQAGKLSEVLEVEREIARVREEIERVEGRMRFVKNLATLSTVTLNVTERHGYEALPEEPSLAERIKWGWRESTHALVEFSKGFIVVVVRLIPWLPVMAILFGLIVLPIRWLRRRRRNRR